MATIVHLSTLHPRADARIYVREAQTLAARLPHDVVLMIADGQGSVAAPKGEVSVHDLGTFRGGRLGRAIAGPWRAFRAIRRLRPRIVHFHDPELIPLGIVLRAFGHVVIYDVHEDVPRQVATKHWLPAVVRGPVAWAVELVEGVAARLLSALVPATHKIAERFPADRTVTVQNYPLLGELSAVSSAPYRERPEAFVYPGALADIRGTQEMVDALARLKRPAVRLHLAGPYSPPSYARTLEAMPGWAQVTYHGVVSRPEVGALLATSRAGMVVHHPIPNEVDAQPIKTFEYMSVGLPVIASDFPAWRRIIGEAGCGLLVNPLDPQAVADAMQWILDHPDEAEAMGQRGRRAVVERFNWEAESAQLLALYARFLPVS